MAEWQRTHTCNELRAEHVGQTVTLNGWVLTARKYGNQIFIDIRDRYGLTQVVFESDNPDLYAQAESLKDEWVLSVTGVVRKRLPGAGSSRWRRRLCACSTSARRCRSR
jgi:aspartyl-tRNA synthetase